MYDAVIISDLHLGSRVCQRGKLVRFLNDLWFYKQTKNLIVNGDLFDSPNTKGCPEISNILLHQFNTVFIKGNHDNFQECMIPFEQAYLLTSGNKNIYVFHGDFVDEFIRQHPWLTWIGEKLYDGLQLINLRLAYFIKRYSKILLHCSEQVEKEARALIGNRYDMVVCGHTHIAKTSEDGVYFNSGCWTEPHCHYLTVKDGKVELHEYIDSN